MSGKKLRILALPLSKRQTLVAFHAINPARDNSPGSQEISYMSKAINWSSRKWDALGDAKPDSWKRKIWKRGESIMDQIEFEEWSLKGLDKQLGPKVLNSSNTKDESNIRFAILVPLLYPQSQIEASQLNERLLSILKYRAPHHRKKMWQAVAIVPLTFPFAFIPVIPNFPLFYVLWRVWSHWRANTSSEYLLQLMERKQLQPQSSTKLDKIYKGASTSRTDHSEEVQLLLSSEQVEKIVQDFSLSKQAHIELERALSQASARLKEPEEVKETQKTA